MKWVITSFNVYKKGFFSWNIIFTRNKMTTKLMVIQIWVFGELSFLNKKSVISKEREERQVGRGNMPCNARIRAIKAKLRILENLYVLPCLKASITQTCLMRSVMTLTRVQDICNSVSQHFPHDLCLMLQNHVRVKVIPKYKTHQWILK